MPIKQTRQGCYKYGDSGKEYCGRDAKKKAIKQGIAIKASGYKEKKGR